MVARRSVGRWRTGAWLGLGCMLLGACGSSAGGESDAQPPDGAIDSTLSPTPGSSIAMQIDRVVVDGQRQVMVDFRLAGSDGSVLDHRGFTINWTLAALTVDATSGATVYINLITRPAQGAFGMTAQPAAETANAYQPLGAGARYTFAVRIPDGADLGGSFRVGAWAQEIVDGGTARVANATADFVPNGKSAPLSLATVDTAACNQCHNPLSAHGGARREVALCVTCHTTQLFDPDTEDPGQPGQMNPLEFQMLIHRIHEGRDLPTVVAAAQAGVVGAKFHVIGFRGSDRVYGQSVANGSADGGTLARASGVWFPRDQRECAVCHQQAPAAAKWQTVLSRAVCGSCHDATWFAATTPPPLFHAHPGGAMADDQACATCHAPSGAEFDLSVSGAHTVPGRSTQLRGLHAKIVSVTGSAGGNPAVTFQITNADGTPVAPLSALDTLAATVSGPTSAYRFQNMIRQDVRATAQPNADGTWTFQFPSRAASDAWLPSGPVIPSDARGTFAVGLEARRAVTLAAEVTYEEGLAENPVAYFSVDGSALAPYASPVDLARCDRCHGEQRNHGGLRRSPEYCVLCHTADATDWARRPKGPDRNVNLAATVDGIEEQSIRLPVLIHRLHTGNESDSTGPFVVYGFGGSFDFFNEIHFPGNRADCATCHQPGQYLVETIPATALPTVANETATIMHQGTAVHAPGEPALPPVQSACLACHDSPAAQAHAALQTTSAGVEACVVCHGEGREASVRTVHFAD
jgi:OmcA/MtrC family decaheme c-type cytochrome